MAYRIDESKMANVNHSCDMLELDAKTKYNNKYIYIYKDSDIIRA
jgi:hypothetical protein